MHHLHETQVQTNETDTLQNMSQSMMFVLQPPSMCNVDAEEHAIQSLPSLEDIKTAQRGGHSVPRHNCISRDVHTSIR